MTTAQRKRRYALFGAGAAGRTVLAEVPCFRTELGPIAAANTKVATRIANLMQTGTAVKDLAGFDECPVILVCAPDTGLARAVTVLCEAEIEWKGKTILFCLSGAASQDFPCFRERGAAVGSLNAIDGVPDYYVTEGDPDAVREAKRLVKQVKGRTLEIHPARVRLFEAARTLSGSLFTPMVDSCAEWIHAAGVESKEAVRVAEKMLLWTLRSYLHSGRRGWTGPAAARDWGAIAGQHEAVRKISALQADYFMGTAKPAFALYESFPELARYLRKERGAEE